MSGEPVELRQADYVVPAEAANWQKRALIVGVVGAVLCIIGAFLPGQLTQLLRGYLIAYVFWYGLTVGGMALLMLQYLTGGLAFLVVRRVAEAAVKGLPLMFVLFLPILLGRHYLYDWMNDPTLTVTLRNHWYLNTPGWIIRWLIYFAIWGAFSFVIVKRGDRHDEPIEAPPRLQGICGFGLVLYALTVSFASFDWVMSLDPHWGSTI